MLKKYLSCIDETNILLLIYEAFNLISVFVENHSLLSGTDEIPYSMNQNVNGRGLFHGYCTISKNVNHFISVTKCFLL
jgi:hypothetical protein